MHTYKFNFKDFFSPNSLKIDVNTHLVQLKMSKSVRNFNMKY